MVGTEVGSLPESDMFQQISRDQMTVPFTGAAAGNEPLTWGQKAIWHDMQLRACYDPDDLSEVGARLDAQRGYPASVTCRVNDQRAMTMRADAEAALEVTPGQISERLAETSLAWLGPRENMHEQVNILVENRSGVVSLHMMWDLACLANEQVEALLRNVEEIAVEAAFDPAAPTKVSG
jgi:hypothetical protein